MLRQGASRRAGALAWLCLAILLAALPARAQEFGLPDSTILVIDSNRVFAQTAFGKRVEQEIEADSAALAAENRRIEAELSEEEQALTEERPGMAPEAFREQADAFDFKVKRIRDEQEAKAVALATERETAQRRFLAVARPVLEELLRESGAVVLLDQRSVLLSVGAVDITEESVRRIDLAIGDGSGNMPETPAPTPSLPDQE